MSNNAANFSGTRAESGGGIVSGLVTELAPRGAMYTHTRASNGDFILSLASGKKGFHVERDVVEAIPLENVVFLKDFVHPALVNTVVSARHFEDCEAEGAALVLLSGTGAIASDTALNTELSTNAGRWSVRQTGEELAGYLRGIIPAQGDGPFRIFVEEVGQ